MGWELIGALGIALAARLRRNIRHSWVKGGLCRWDNLGQSARDAE